MITPKSLKKATLLLGAIVFSFTSLKAQTPFTYQPLYDNLTPVTPTAFQFLKYVEMPVSEYTGLPNISIPLYDINVDGVKIPLNLTYHASGVRVSEEASWVGLGWDLSLGSIVQQINDSDDLSSYSMSGDPLANVTKMLPDAIGSPLPSEFPLRYIYGQAAAPGGFGWSDNIPDLPPILNQTFKIFTDYYAPFNGDCLVHPINFFNTHDYYDSEPDIFKANFLGYSVNFIMDWSSINKSLTTNGWSGSIDSFVILNKQGYKVTFNSDHTFTITVPDGTIFNFKQFNTSLTQSQTVSPFGNSTPGWPKSFSRVWMLTGITTKNNQKVTLNYAVTSSYNNFPNYSENWQQATLQSSLQYDYMGSPVPPYIRAFPDQSSVGAWVPGPSGNLSKSTTTSSEEHVYLSSITFPKGQVNFITSAAQDVLGGQKLDSIAITGSQLVKSYKLNYDYFNTSTTGGSGFMHGSYDASYANTPFLRLKLLSVKDNTGGVYSLQYNSTPLPNKDCFAQDYWGFYNGQLSNTTLIPNPAQFNQAGGYNNGDNHSANLAYAQAAILQAIQYPTGGTVNFSYELNAFNTYWVPDLNSNANTVSHGNGLRVHAVTWKQPDGTQSKQDVYTYSTGKAILPVSMFRSFNSNYQGVSGSQITVKGYSMIAANASGYYSSNPFGSITGIGYDTVSRQVLDVNGNAIGKTVTTFYNTPDVIDNTASSFSQASISLPAIKQNSDPENGTLKSVYFYDQQNNLLKKTINKYTINYNSKIYYGARLCGYTNFIYWESFAGNNSAGYRFLDQHMVGYYPIYDYESLPAGSTETEYFGNDSLVVSSSNGYDQYHQLYSNTTTNSTGSVETDYTYPYNYNTAILNQMAANNRLTDIVSVTKSRTTTNPFLGRNLYYLKRNYASTGNLIVASKDSIDEHPNLGESTQITYDAHDNIGNLLQYTAKNQTFALIWDYNKQYVVAEVKNAAYNNIAYTSFEADGIGRWKYTGTVSTVNGAMTGDRSYALSTGNIYRDSLDASNTYVVSYWSKSGVQQVNGSSAAQQGYSFNGWTYYQHLVANPSTVTITGSGIIDEVRLYPQQAQMTSYTCQPLVGIRTSADASGRVNFYEYDGSQRLYRIKDINGNIVKQYCYNYSGQVTDCSVPYTQPAPPAYTYTPPTGGGTSPPPTCGKGTKLINGVCVTGRKDYETSTFIGSGRYTCTYHYTFPDGTTSQEYSESNSQPCAL